MGTLLGIALCALAANGPAEASSERVEFRTYPMPLIASPRLECYRAPLGFFPILPDVAAIEERGSWTTTLRRYRADAEAVHTVLEELLQSAGFEEAPGYSFDTHGDLYVLSHTPQGHEIVRQGLATIQATLARSYAVRVVILPPKAVASARGPILSPADARKLSVDEGGLSYEVTAEAGQRVVLGGTRETSYVSDFDVEVAQESRIADPIVSIAREGVSVGVRARFAGPGFVAIETTAEVTSLERPVASIALQLPELGALELPEFGVTRVGASAVVPVGGGLLLGCTGGDGSEPGRAAVLVMASPIEIEAPPRSGLMVLDVDFLTHSRRRFSLSSPRSLGGALMAREPAVMWSLPERGEQGTTELPEWFGEPIIEPDFLAELLTAAVGDRAESVRLVRIGPALIAAKAESQDLDRIAATIESLTRAMRRNVTIEAAVVKLSRAIRSRLEPGRGALPDDVMEALQAGKGGSVLLQAGAASIDGDATAIAIGHDSAVLTDYDPEIAEDSQISDPVVHQRFTGLALEVRPVRGADAGTLILEVNGSLSRPVSGSVTKLTGAEHIGALQEVADDVLDARGTWLVTPGRWSFRVLDDSPGEALALGFRCTLRDE